MFTQAKILSIVGKAIVLLLNKSWKQQKKRERMKKQERKTEEKKEKDRGEERERKGKEKGSKRETVIAYCSSNLYYTLFLQHPP